MLTSKLEPYFPASLQVGCGFDIYGEFSMRAVTARIFDPSKADTRFIEIDRRRYAIPSYVHWRPHSTASYIEDVCETRDQFQNLFAAEAGIHADMGAFSGQMDVAFSKEVTTSAEHYFSCKNYYQSVGHFHLEFGADLEQLLDGAFLQAVARLPAAVTPDNQRIFDDFFDDYGTHLTQSLKVGGHLEYYVAVSKSVSSDKQTIRAAMNAEYTASLYTGRLDAKRESSKEHQAFASSRHVTIRGGGGDASLLGRVVAADPRDPDLDVIAALGEWTRSIERNPVESQCTLMPIANICGRKENVVLQAFESYKARKRVEVLIEQRGRLGGNEHPLIMVGGMPIKPEKKMEIGEVGFHVVVLDRTQLTERVGIVLNRVICRKNSDANYVASLYQELRQLLATEAYRAQKHLLIIASKGMLGESAPDSETYLMLLSAGGTDELSRWVEDGHRGGGDGRAILFSHVGIFGSGRDAGVNDYLHLGNHPWAWGHRATAFLYGSRGSLSMYRLGAGERRSLSAAAESLEQPTCT